MGLKGYFAKIRFLSIIAMALVVLALANTTYAQPKADNTRPSVYVVSFGMFGSQSVFDSEARSAADILVKYFRSPFAPFIRTNTKKVSGVTSASLEQSMHSARKKLKHDNDILVLFMTSHGARSGIAVFGRKESGIIPPAEIGRLLKVSKVRHRILIVSACYSGIFADHLADKDTLVITAAASNRSSFGCEDRAEWTYFGEAFFKSSLQSGRSLTDAFNMAKFLVHIRELAEGIDTPSNPQMRGGENVLALFGDKMPATEPATPEPAVKSQIIN